VFDNQAFAALVKEGRPSGEVVGMVATSIRVRGLEGASINSMVLFENGDRGLVRSINDQFADVMALSKETIGLGMVAVLEREVYRVPVGDALIGRIVNVLGEPIDGKGPITATAQAEVFAPAPGIIERELLSDQLVTGVTIVDALFPFVLGQRLVILGDSKAGKSTFLRQLSAYQTAAGQIVVYVLIGKRQVEIDILVAELRASKSLDHMIVVVATSTESLSLSFLAPYAGCAMAEHLWRAGRNVIVVYDDLSNHAKIYRELALTSGANPGRDSYPGDMFFAHSSLLERAGKLAGSTGTLSALAVAITPSDDITAYLPTNIMSITDGQIVFDLQSFRQGIRPAVNVGLSVSRVGGRVQDAHWKAVSGQLFRKLADYRQASAFAQFGSELTSQAQADLNLGRTLYEMFRQAPTELYTLGAQYLMLSVALAGAGKVALNVRLLKEQAIARAGEVQPNTDPAAVVADLLVAATVQVQV
jgi:F-type H+-transporting ATPase subunit alpha